MKAVMVMTGIAAAAFFVLFSPWTHNAVPFFPLMTTTAFSLAVVSLVLQRKETGYVYAFNAAWIPLGVLSAVFLYGIFWVGHFLSIRLLPFAAAQVDSIYTIRAGQNPWIIAGLLVFIIGPAEEIFWRGFVQKRLSNKYGVLVGVFIATVCYTGVHLWSFNLMLLAASAVCGAFWGLLFAATDNLWPAIISHAVWDVTIFILFPIT